MHKDFAPAKFNKEQMLMFSSAQTEGWLIGTSLTVSAHINATSMFIFSPPNSGFITTLSTKPPAVPLN